MVPDGRFHELLMLLADGEYHSGQELGSYLGISRAAVWKHLQKLEDLAVPLESHRGRGYCIRGGLDLLQEPSLRASLSAAAAPLLSNLTIYSEIDSTNGQLLRSAASLPSGSLCLAERQLAGRGRRGRAWVSPFAQNIYLSVLWRFGGGASVLEGLSLAVGVALARALESRGFSAIELKWPNDLLSDGRKLAGILLEMSGDPSGDCQVVVGVGVNVWMSPAAASAIDQPWVDLAELAVEQGVAMPTRNQLAADVISQLLPLLGEYDQLGFAAWRAEWLARAAYVNKEVHLATPATQLSGQFVGVDGAGALLLNIDGDIRSYYGGEVSLRVVS